ncbi:MAG: metallophosphoesterase family protein [Geminicoccaceae bacterium]
MLRSLFRRPNDDNGPSEPTAGGVPARVPPGVCVYAIGDIHGRLDLVDEMHRLITVDAAQLTPGTEKLVVYVGDYVDRGLESREVIDALIDHPLPDFRPVHLLGNHDAWLLTFLVDPRVGPTWLRYGGDATLASYGVRVGTPVDEAPYYEQLQSSLRERVPRRHVEFLQSLELSYETGDYLFVHAGVRPSLPLDRQTADDLLWIREPFLSCRQEFGKVVVHGHTVDAEPTVRANRIGIDTGACWTGCLTCLVLEEGDYRFLSTAHPIRPALTEPGADDGPPATERSAQGAR